MRITASPELSSTADVSGALPDEATAEGFEVVFRAVVGGEAGGGVVEREVQQIDGGGEESGSDPALMAAGEPAGVEVDGSLPAPAAAAVLDTPKSLEDLGEPVREAGGVQPATCSSGAEQIRVAEADQFAAGAGREGSSEAVQRPAVDRSEGGRRPAEVRARAAEAFRARAERLWGYWLRTREAEPVAGTETALPREGEAAAGAESSEPDLAHDRARIRLPENAPAAARVNVSSPPAGTGLAQGTISDPAPEGVATDPAAPSSSSDSQSGASDRSVAGPRPGVPAEPANQVAQAVRVSMARGGSRVAVQLEPESLGKVHVVLARQAGGVTAHLRVETPEAQQALQGDVAQLRQALESRGVTVIQISVELDHGESQGRSPWASLNRRRRRPAADSDDSSSLDRLEAHPPPWRPWGFDARV